MKKIDIYGEPVKITLNKKNFIQTSMGGLLTILTFKIVLIFTWFIGKDILFKEKPVSYIQTDIFPKYLNITINKQNFPFSITMTDDNNIPLLDFSYLQMKLSTLEYEINEESGDYTLKNIFYHEIKQCNYSSFPLLNIEQFNNTQLGLTFCPINQNFSLYGYWSEEKLKYLQVSIERCKNSTNNPIICKSPEEIHDYISRTGTNLNIYYVDTKVMINNNTHPIEFLSSASYRYVIPEYYKKTTFKIQTQNIKTDNGFLFNSNEDKNFFKMVEDFTDLRLIDEVEYKLLVFEIFSSNFSETYFRRYIKVSEIIASLGGVLKVFSLGFLYLNLIFSKVEKNVSIVNELFVLNKKNEYKDNDVSKHLEKSNNSLKNTYAFMMNNYMSDIQKIHKESKGSKGEKENYNFDTTPYKKTNHHYLFKNIHSPENNNEEKEKSEKIKKFLAIRKSNLKLNFKISDVMYVICNTYCKKKIPKNFKENFFYYKKSKICMENYFDIIFMIKKFEEVGILKDCLLTEVQGKMVEIISKPILSMKDKIKKNSLTVKNIGDMEYLTKNVQEFFMKEDMEENRINKNILKKIDEYIDKSYYN